MSAVLADTHAVLWYLASPERLSSAATAALDDALAANARIYVASISVVEVAYLVEKGRLPGAFFDSLLAELTRPDGGLTVVALDLDIAGAVRRVPRATVPDMPDRIIAATARHLGVPVVTHDARIHRSGVGAVW